ncbi:MAG: ROK family protein [Candidatus Micrarchaeia archaeon]
MSRKLWIGSFARTSVRMGESPSKSQQETHGKGPGRRDRRADRQRGQSESQKNDRQGRRGGYGGAQYQRRDERRGQGDDTGRAFQSREQRKSYYREAILAIDVGGTKSHAILEVNGKIVGELRVGTPKKNHKLLVDAITTLAQRVGARDVSAIGLCMPGFVEDGVVHGLPNIGITGKIEIGKEVSKRLGAPVVVENDSKAFAIAEYAAGAGKGANPLLGITFGTGVGGGAVINGEMYTGAKNMSCEFGHVKVAAEGEACGCGGTGCLETFCSGKAIEREYRKRLEAAGGKPGEDHDRPHQLDAHIISQTASAKEILENNDDKIAIEVCRRAAWFAGRGAGSMANAFNPQKIVIGGSVAPHYLEKYAADFREGFLSAAIGPLQGTPVSLAKFENPSLEGALILAKAYLSAQKGMRQQGKGARR